MSLFFTGLTREDVAIYMRKTRLSDRVRYLDEHIADSDCMERLVRLRERQARQRDLEWQKTLARTLGAIS